MAQHYVTCLYCGQRFDRDIEPAVSVSAKRYAHINCAKEHEELIKKEEQDYEDLEKYIMKLFSKEYVTARIKKQIKDYHKEYDYSFSGMLKTLKWWYEIRGNSIDKANEGIGIIPFIYDQAEKYYYNLFLAKEANQNIDIFNPVIEEIEIAPPQAYSIPPKLFKFENEVEEK
ncbi:MAG: hypothetical protein ACI4PE_02835 [Bacilli bacterium]